ncbi:hypothetical protein GCK72_021026 [Caenorhabditis remanei]|uniref:F-box domain-containing protein n=1 Tax=Caenorhabditis remanei TaxID=31234 RepID=A0A6A5GIF5_CAERE|nr:hypothetical protein GCK72_021026 [Caenorhabditis remanei]KAF1754463.1 hypothetical protein GCK72_021026 [Caenorhabditis remanei]
MSTTSTLEFSNLPTDTIEKIIEKCDLKEQMTLRKVSRKLRSLVDEQKLGYKSIAIILNDSYIICGYNDKRVTYASGNWDEEYEEYEQEELGLAYEEFWILKSNDYKKIALNDVSIALNNPKLRLDELTVSFDSRDEVTQFRLEGLLKHLNHQIHVKTLTFRAGSPEYLLSILPCLKPKVLVNIEIYEGLSEKAAEKVRQVARLEQWKQAEQFTAHYCFHYLPLECLMHFKRFLILNRDVTEQFLIDLRDLFSKSINFEACTVESFGLDNYPEYLEPFCEKVKSEGEVIYHFKIPDDSNKILEFKIYNYDFYDQIDIEKKNF